MDWLYPGNILAATCDDCPLMALSKYALNFLPGLAVGRLFDMGWFYVPLGGASSLLVAATFLTGECTRYWQFLLCQGITVGVSSIHVFWLRC